MIVPEKEIYMSRPSKFLAATLLVVFLLACNVVSQPFKDAENLAATAQSLGSAIPMETLQALSSAIPQETLQALPSAIPTLEEFMTNMPDIGNILDPQGAPVQEWKGIPIMPQATAGQEFPESNMYSFRAKATPQEVQDFYKEKLTALGWSQPFDIPDQQDGMGMIVFQKGSNSLTIMIITSGDSIVVNLTLV
jgi:hypothetical protein